MSTNEQVSKVEAAEFVAKAVFLRKFGSALNWFRYNMALVIPAIGALVIFTILRPDFVSGVNLSNILREMTIVTILAMGLTVVMATGKFDLSFYGVGNFAVMTGAFLLSKHNFPFVLMILLCIAIGFGAGSLSGLLVSVLRLPDLMATIGVAGLFAGLAFRYTEGVQVWLYQFPRILWIGRTQIGPITFPVLVLIAVVVLTYILLYKLKYGVRMQAVGTNPDASTHAGISVKKYRFLAFAIAGTLYGVASVIYLGRFAKGLPTPFDALILPVIAATFMGTAMFKGKANVVGTLIGAFTFVSILNALTLMNIHWTKADLYRPLIFLSILIPAIYIRKKRIVG